MQGFTCEDYQACEGERVRERKRDRRSTHFQGNEDNNMEIGAKEQPSNCIKLGFDWLPASAELLDRWSSHLPINAASAH
ncbi:hypothetical protein CDL15_Pgr019994 [Punica granatum]|uniref:Uncharacterized protein n=1 Tax=Punica granatum TaxID=22663 RepID=A0A218VRI4_PUNGR|nr:hypothetical protein CDL15_Pgr019994 [Punica granatum]